MADETTISKTSSISRQNRTYVSSASARGFDDFDGEVKDLEAALDDSGGQLTSVGFVNQRRR